PAPAPASAPRLARPARLLASWCRGTLDAAARGRACFRRRRPRRGGRVAAARALGRSLPRRLRQGAPGGPVARDTVGAAAPGGTGADPRRALRGWRDRRAVRRR